MNLIGAFLLLSCVVAEARHEPADGSSSSSCDLQKPTSVKLALIQKATVHSHAKAEVEEPLPKNAKELREAATVAASVAAGTRKTTEKVAATASAKDVETAKIAKGARQKHVEDRQAATSKDQKKISKRSMSALVTNAVLRLTRAQTQTRNQNQNNVSLASALGITDIISLIVLVLVILLALYFFWGGTKKDLAEDPLGALRQTTYRAGEEAKDEFYHLRSQYNQAPQGAGMSDAGNPFQTRRTKDPVCC
eukprot:TRINITY_DN5884_c1_g1_i2.p1 TRINITY_DN5884_c1_g1~~TRINITY_DN5884_c1_g1_i2.p1  ORF type:complete len:250 (+),score=51.53 TRINITY_DN5884_c1_g1_i2:71-820(+)